MRTEYIQDKNILKDLSALYAKDIVTALFPCASPFQHPSYQTTTEPIHLEDAFLECITHDNNC